MHSDTSIRILIAEDEPIILNNIAKKASRAGEWAEITGMAESGSEALAILESKPADILITDIEMPGMNGLELIRTVRERYPQMKIIILSGYSNFEYARTALRYGVNDYLLKPVAQETMTELLEKLEKQISGEKSSRRREILSMALNGNVTPTEFPASLTEGCFYLISLTIGNYGGHFGTPEISEEYLKLWDKFILSDSLKGFPELNHTWMIDEAYALCKFAILHSTKGQLSAGRLRLVLEQYCIQQFAGYPYLLLIFPQPISCHEIWDTAKKLRQISLQFSRPFVQEAYLSDEIGNTRSTGIAELTRASGVMKNLSSSTAFLQYVQRTTKEFLDKDYPSQLLMKFITEVFTCAEAVFMSDTDRCRSTAAGIYGNFYSCPDKDTFVKLFSERLEQLLDDGHTLTGDNLCSKITGYIQAHFCTRLSLNDLSEHFGYTSSYINRIFKKDLGISPLQYITNLKIEKAKELLRLEQPMDIRDVAAAIGYEDARYFSRVFKNETGMTPTVFAANKKPPMTSRHKR